jgi:hypothetical protein
MTAQPTPATEAHHESQRRDAQGVEHVLALVEAVHGTHLDTVHVLALDAALVDDVGQLGVLSADRSGELIHGVCHCGARSLAENGRRGDQRPLARSERRTVDI